jgi:adenylate cyclase
MLAAAARSIAVLVILAWTAHTNPERGAAVAWVIGTGSFFLVTGAAQLWLYARNLAPPHTPYVFILLDSLALAAVLLMPNPFATVPIPPGMPLRFANFIFFFVLLMQMAFSFRPRLV